jgi:hypothetical protein
VAIAASSSREPSQVDVSRVVRHRAACPGNGRVTNATLTDAGFDLVVSAAPAHVELARTYVLDALNPDQVGQLAAIAGQILATVDPDGD